jgi:hypothetical protein
MIERLSAFLGLITKKIIKISESPPTRPGGGIAPFRSHLNLIKDLIYENK